jgi:acyl-CoA reductase-like NAD-dependent aldehyde dehydrogenase
MKVVKTLKLYINGQFERSESGRSFVMNNPKGEAYARLCLASRKDFRNASEHAKNAQAAWARRSAYNRGQILYRMAEMMVGKKTEFKEVLVEGLGLSETEAETSLKNAIDSFVYYAGFSDKYLQLSGSINPVSSPHHNFTTTEPVGLVTYFEAADFSLEKLCARLASIIVSGNAVVVIMGPSCPAIMSPLSEVFATSDLPAGIINLLTGDREELYKPIGSHREIRSIAVDDKDSAFFYSLKALGVDNMKRCVGPREDQLSLMAILDFVEYKTAWHPIGL